MTKEDESKAHYDLGNAYYNQGKLEQAVVEYQKTLSIDPNNADVHCNVGLAYHCQGNFIEWHLFLGWSAA